MEIDRQKNGGLFFRLEKLDWQCDWQTFLEGVKMIRGWEYCPAEKPYEEKWWWIPEHGVSTFYQHKKQIFDNIQNAGQIGLWEE